ncbi:hypothetical protein AB833_19865 [Chromatiales bacterium (ex Bugula neritina AB1)]|nr:hypothetical protein AB833_19865 [Chromatiales bacterium (ex Bugula neritina AB1)]
MSWLESVTDYFLRPAWLLAVPVVLVFIMWLQLRSVRAGWGSAIRADMLAILRIPDGSTRRTKPVLLSILLIAVCIALAGPVRETGQRHHGYNRQATVVLLDLSRSMLAGDIAPDRLTRARLKLIDLLRKRRDGETALIVYAGDAHLVAPLTDDAHVIESLVPALEPSIMPLAGSNPEAAVDMAVSLFAGADLTRGDIILITDGVDPGAIPVISQKLKGSRLSILSVGTLAGAPVPDTDGKFLLEKNGEPRIEKPDTAQLKLLAEGTAGRFVELSNDNRDIDYLTAIVPLPFRFKLDGGEREVDQRQDSGYWLIFPIMLIGVFGFRRNLLWIVLLGVLIPPRSYAAEWQNFWYTPDQRAARALAHGDSELAASLFTNKQWRAIALYRNSNYEQAARLFNSSISADGFYNMGNAYALAGNISAAIEAFRVAISIDVKHRDAAFNLKLLNSLVEENNREKQSASGGRNPSGGDDSSVDSGDTESGVAQASAMQQLQLGGVSAAADSLDQGRLTEGGQSVAADAADSESQKLATDASAVDDANVAAQLTEFYAGSDAEENALAATPEQNSNTVLNPYSEQWLRNLPQDPGGYLRRKFHYQAQMRLEAGESIPDSVRERL